MSDQIRVLIVDDQDLIRDGVRMIVDAHDDLTVVATAADGAEAIETVRARRVDVVLMDIRMPGVDGITATERICALPEAPRVVMLTTFDLDENVLAALRAGASGFLVKSARRRGGRGGTGGHRGDARISPSSTRRLIDHVLPSLGTAAAPPDGYDRLTAREREVLDEVVQGSSNAEIGKRLFLSEATVKTHVGRVLTKLGPRDRVQLVVLAYRTGMVERN